MSTDLGGSVARSAGVVAQATIASRVLGLVRDVVLANAFTPSATDAFFLAFTIPNLFRRLVAEGSLTLSFVPVFTSWLHRSRSEAKRVFDTTWTLATLVGVAITLAGILFADPLVRLFAPGFAADPSKHALTVELLRLCFPYILLLMLVAVAMGALNSVGHFFAPAFAPAFLNLCMIAGAFAGNLWFDPPILALGYAVLLAGLVQVLFQLPSLARRGLQPALGFEVGHPAIRRLGALMVPATLGASVYQVNVLVSRLFSSFLGEGAVSYLYYADRLLELPLGIFIFALQMASLPSFSRLATRGDRAGLQQSFASTLALALVLVVGSTVGLVLLREPIFAVLFAWDPSTFGDEAVRGCAEALLYYALGLVPISVARVFVMASVAHEDTRIPAHAAFVSVAVNALASVVLIGPLPAGALPAPLLAWQHAIAFADLGFAGLALAATIASCANAAYVAVAVWLRHGPLLRRKDVGRLLGIAAAAVPLALAVEISSRLWPVPASASLAGTMLLLLHIAVGAGTYGLALALCGSPELRVLIGVFRRRRR